MLRNRSALLLAFVLSFSLAACEENSGTEPAAVVTGDVSLPAAEALMKKRELDAAATMLQKILESKDAPALASQRLAEVYIVRDDLAKAVKVLRAGEERHPEAGDLPLLLAKIYQKIKQFPDMRAALDRARAAKAPEKDVAMLYATCMGQLEDLDGAAQEFEKARAAGADAKVVDYNLAIIRIQKKEYVQAKELLDAVVAADDSWTDAKRERAHVVMLTTTDRPSIEEQMNALVTLREAAPKDYRIYEYLGDGSLLLGDYEGGVRMYTEALRIGRNPESVQEKYRTAYAKLVEKVGEKPASKIAAEAAAAAREIDQAESAPAKPAPKQ